MMSLEMDERKKNRKNLLNYFRALGFLSNVILFLFLSSACQSNSENASRKSEIAQKLTVTYTGEGDMVQFTMFEGFSQYLVKDTVRGVFEVDIKIPDLNEGIFTYDLSVQKMDSLGMTHFLKTQSNNILLNQNLPIVIRDQYLWIGKNRKNDFIKSDEISGSLTTSMFTSTNLKEGRELTIYSPLAVSTSIPYIYFTDGSVVGDYAGYVDELITSGVIEPIKLIGIHSSDSNRLQEYVEIEEGSQVFSNHEKFVFNEVFPTIEQEIYNWNGKRYFYGFSNGADFCMYGGMNYPDLFEEIIAFSAASYPGPIFQTLWPTQFQSREYPFFYMGSGRYEESIFIDNKNFVDVMRNNDIDVAFKEYISGHDYNVWRIEFLEFIVDRFSKKGETSF